MIEDLDSVAGTLLDIIEVCGYTIKFNDPR